MAIGVLIGGGACVGQIARDGQRNGDGNSGTPPGGGGGPGGPGAGQPGTGIRARTWWRAGGWPAPLPPPASA